jgi:ribonuclease T2
MSMSVTRPLFPLFLSLWTMAAAAEPIHGSLTADRDCPAGVSTKHSGNPGQVRLVPGQVYTVVARNRPEPSHYQLRIEGAEPKDRWVEVSCGRFSTNLTAWPEAPAETAPVLASRASGLGAPTATTTPGPAPAPAPAVPPKVDRTGGGMESQYVLAASWQPAFCEKRAAKPECVVLTPSTVAGRHFSLHGLWPQPIGRAYCGVAGSEREDAENGNWRRLPAPQLTPATRTALAERMPGTVSQLDRHEWTKHGTCYGTDAETYFRQSLALLDQLNASEVQRLFEANIGKRLRAEEVRAAFDRAFGPGSGERVRLDCDQDGQITELRIGLKGQIHDGSALGDLIRAAPTRTADCRGGWVDRAGPGR